MTIFLPKRNSLWKPPLGTPINTGHPLARGLLACWLNNEGAKGTVRDITGNGYNATWSTNCFTDRTISAGPYGPAITKAAGSPVGQDGLTFSSLKVGTTYSVAMWVNLSSVAGNYQNLISFGSSLGFWAIDGRIDRFFASDHLSNTTVATNTWVFWAYSCNNGTGTFYLNGVPDGTVSSDPGFPVNGMTGMLCDNGGAEQFTGTWSHTYVYNRALSASEVQQLYIQPFCFMQQQRLWLPTGATAAATDFAWRRYLPPSPTIKPSLGALVNSGNSLSQGLQAGYLFNEGGGETVYDVTGQHASASMTNSTWTTGKFGAAQSFSLASTSYINTGLTADSTWENLTISCWIETSTTGSSSIINGISGSVGVRIQETSSGNLTALAIDSSFNILNPGNTASTYTDGKWHHLCLTINNGTLILYVDTKNVLSTTNASYTGNLTGAGSFYIGSNSTPGNYFTGNIDMPFFWNRALSPAEVQKLYQSPFAMVQGRYQYLPGNLGAAPTFSPFWANRSSLAFGGVPH